MSTEGLILALALTAGVLALVFMPLLRRDSQRSAEDLLHEKQRERLTLYYERVLRNIRDLDEDNAVGKLAPAEYQRERALWVERGAQALRALDDLNALAVTSAEDSAVDHAIDDAIEAAVAAQRQKANRAVETS